MWINKIIYSVITIYAGILLFLYNEPATLYVFLILVSYPIVLKFIVIQSKKKLVFKIKCKHQVLTRNTPIECKLAIQYKSRIPIGSMKVEVSYRNQFSKVYNTQSFSVGIPGQSKQSIYFTLYSKHVGIIELKVHKVIIYDYLRIFSCKLTSKEVQQIFIMPDIYDIESKVRITKQDFVDSNMYSKTKTGDDPSEVFDIRGYKEGDKIHRIHWKLSTKKDSILVKEYSLPISCDITILIDLFFGDKQRVCSYMDGISTVVGSISYHLLMNEYTHYITWLDMENEVLISSMIKDLDDLNKVLEQLLSVVQYQNETDLIKYYEVYNNTQSMMKLYYVSATPSDTVMERLYSQSNHAQIEVIQVIGENQVINKDSIENESGIGIWQYINLVDIKSGVEGLIL